MSDKHSKKRKRIRIIPKTDGMKIMMLFLLIGEAAVFACRNYLDVLPLRYFLVLLAIVVAADIGISILLTAAEGSNKKLVGLCCVMILLIVFTACANYIFSTLDTISKITVSSEDNSSGIAKKSFNIYISGVDF